MHEWIPEAMGLLRTNVELVPAYKSVKISYHVGELPCGLLDLEAVEYCGFRLRYYTGVRAPQKLPTSETTVSENWTTEATTTDMPSGPVLDLKVVQAAALDPSNAYRIYLGHIQTTFADGEVTLYYKHYLTDDRGLPLIPDHGDYKEALYWWVRAKMIQSGWDDPVYGHDDRISMERFEKYAARAISDITYPSVDQKGAALVGSLHFVPPVDYYDSFFHTQLPEPPYMEGSQPNFVKLNTVTLNNGETSA